MRLGRPRIAKSLIKAWLAGNCPRSLPLRGGELHHLRPLVGVAQPELAEFRGGEHDRPPAHLGEARRDARIGEAGIDLAAERAGPVTASARSAPERMCGSEFGKASIPASTRPPMRSAIIGAPP